jgi:hypothetical protein
LIEVRTNITLRITNNSRKHDEYWSKTALYDHHFANSSIAFISPPNERVDRGAALPNRIDKKAAAPPVERTVRRKIPRLAITLRVKPTDGNNAKLDRNQAHRQETNSISKSTAKPHEQTSHYASGTFLARTMNIGRSGAN